MLFNIQKNIELDKYYEKYCDNINYKYFQIIKNDLKNKILLHSIDNKIDSLNENISSFIIYRKIILKNDINYIIFLIGVYEDIRNYGYGKLILDEFIENIRIKNKSFKKINIILHSLDESKYFFINYGFRIIDKSKFLKNYEGWNSKEKFRGLILQYTVL